MKFLALQCVTHEELYAAMAHDFILEEILNCKTYTVNIYILKQNFKKKKLFTLHIKMFCFLLLKKKALLTELHAMLKLPGYIHY